MIEKTKKKKFIMLIDKQNQIVSLFCEFLIPKLERVCLLSVEFFSSELSWKLLPSEAGDSAGKTLLSLVY